MINFVDLKIKLSLNHPVGSLNFEVWMERVLIVDPGRKTVCIAFVETLCALRYNIPYKTVLEDRGKADNYPRVPQF